MRRIITDIGLQITEMDSSVEVLNMFKNDYEIIKNQD
ncbi:MAG: hypothetical protein ACJAX7_002527 [Saprospiraceae bacterium]|jgi:hypothetical protein